MNLLMIYLLAAVAFLAVIVAAAVGVIFGRRPIRGSCGGLGSSQKEDSCSLCSNRDSCEESSEGARTKSESTQFSSR